MVKEREKKRILNGVFKLVHHIVVPFLKYRRQKEQILFIFSYTDQKSGRKLRRYMKIYLPFLALLSGSFVTGGQIFYI